MLRAQQISLRLGSKTILKQVDFQAEAGQITVLLGAMAAVRRRSCDAWR